MRRGLAVVVVMLLAAGAQRPARSGTPLPIADSLIVRKTHAGNFSQGQVGAAYEIEVENNGGRATSGEITVTDTLPAGLTATAIAGEGWACVLGTRRRGILRGPPTCRRSDALAVNATFPVITLNVKVSSTAPASVTNEATVSGGGVSESSSDSDKTTITPRPDLTITKTHSASFSRGQVGATYTIVVRNIGGAATTGAVTVADLLPSGLTATGLSGSGWACQVGPRTCTRSDVLPAAATSPSITLTVNVSVDAPATVTNTVTVSGGGESTTTNDSDGDPTSIAAGGSPGPVFTPESACSGRVNFLILALAATAHTASASEAADVSIAMAVAGAPNGSGISRTNGNPATMTITWRPTVLDFLSGLFAGPVVVTITATDNRTPALATLCEVSFVASLL